MSASERTKDLEAFGELGVFRFAAELARGGVGVAVMGDLVSGGGDPLDPLGVSLGDATRDEEGRGDALGRQQVQDQGDGDLRTVRALRQHPGPLGVRRIVGQDPLFGVEVEGEGDGTPLPLRPHATPRDDGPGV